MVAFIMGLVILADWWLVAYFYLLLISPSWNHISWEEDEFHPMPQDYSSLR